MVSRTTNLTSLFVIFPLTLFIIWRQPILNILGVERHVLSGAHGLLLVAIGVGVLFSVSMNFGRLEAPRRTMVFLAWISLILFTVIGIIYARYVSTAQLFYGLIYYAILPAGALIPSTKFWSRNGESIVRLSVYIWVASWIISVFQYFRLDLPEIFKTDMSVAIKETYYGTIRVNGIFGNFVNYAFISYLIYVLALYDYLKNSSKASLMISVAAITAILMTSTRAYIGLMPVATLILLASVRRIKPVLLGVMVVSAIAVFVYTTFPEQYDALVSILESKDEHTQASNEVRIEQMNKAKIWVKEYVTTGLGMGFLLGPNDHKKLWVTDGLWLMIALEIGVVLAIVHIIIMGLFAHASLRLSRMREDGARPVIIVIILSYLMVALINSAHGELVSEWICMMILGGALGYRYRATK